METGKPKKVWLSYAQRKLNRESTNRDRVAQGLDPLAAKKKSKSKPKVKHQHVTPQHTDKSNVDVARSAITDLTKVITYLNKHFHAISFAHQQKHAVQNNDDKYAKIQKLLAEEYDKNTEFGFTNAIKDIKARDAYNKERNSSYRYHAPTSGDIQHGPITRDIHGQQQQHDAHVRKEQRKLDHEKHVNEQIAAKLQR